MSEAGEVLGKLASEEGSKIISKEGTSIFEGLRNWVTSQDSMLRKTKLGSDFADILRNKYEPAVKQTLGNTLEQMKNTGSYHPTVAAKAEREIRQNLAEQMFGKKREAFTALVQQADRERGSVYANSIADNLSGYFGEDAHYEAPWRRSLIKKGVDVTPTSKLTFTSNFERSLRKGASAMMTGRVAIPHLFQAPLNSFLDSGAKNVAKAFVDYFGDKQEALRFVLNSGALSDEIKYELAQSYSNKGLWQKLYGAVRHPGFDSVRRFGIVLSALAGKHAAIEAAQDGMLGNEERASIMLRSFGLNPDAVKANKWVLSEADKLTAAYRGASKDMFIRSGLDTPGAWENSGAIRTAFMYKHFMFNEGRFLKTYFQREYELGGHLGLAKAVAKFALAAPVFGELVTSMDALVTGNDPTQRYGPGYKIGEKVGGDAGGAIGEMIDAMSHAGGFGLFYNIWRDAQRRSLATFLIGPIYGSLTDLAADVGSGNYEQLGRDITRKIPVVGPAVTNAILPRKRGNR